MGLESEEGWASASQDFKDGRKNGALKPRTVEGWGCASQDFKDGQKTSRRAEDGGAGRADGGNVRMIEGGGEG